MSPRKLTCCCGAPPCTCPAAAGQPSAAPLLHSFDLSTLDGYLAYWAQLQYAVALHKAQEDRRKTAASLPLLRCFPVDRMQKEVRGRQLQALGRPAAGVALPARAESLAARAL